MKTILLLLSSFIFIGIACSNMSSKKKDLFQNKDVPGVVFIRENFAIDRTEITNFNWLEFMYWTSEHYGKQSAEYLATLPDTAVWRKIGSDYDDVERYYLRHPAYRNYPVVGITYQQAVEFSKWRSDRVFTYLLIQSKLIPGEYGTTKNADSTVTIERYKSGLIKGIQPHKSVVKYPNYYLPSQQNWEEAMKHNEALALSFSRKQKEQLNQGRKLENYHDATIPGMVSWKVRDSKAWIFNLDANISEWLDDGKHVVGANWKGKNEISEHTSTSEADSTSAMIGFRCVFEWR